MKLLATTRNTRLWSKAIGSILLSALAIACLAIPYALWADQWCALLPRDVLSISLAGALSAVSAWIAAFATGIRSSDKRIARPKGFPKDSCAETARFINAYNILMENQVAEEHVEGASAFALNLLDQAAKRKTEQGKK